MFVNLAFGNISRIDGSFQCLQSASAFEVNFAAESIGGCKSCRSVGFVAKNHGVAFPAIVQRPAIGDDNAVVFPLVAQNVNKQFAVGTARSSVQAVVAAHYLLYITKADNVFKCR